MALIEFAFLIMVLFFYFAASFFYNEYRKGLISAAKPAILSVRAGFGANTAALAVRFIRSGHLPLAGASFNQGLSPFLYSPGIELRQKSAGAADIVSHFSFDARAFFPGPGRKPLASLLAQQLALPSCPDGGCCLQRVYGFLRDRFIISV